MPERVTHYRATDSVTPESAPAGRGAVPIRVSARSHARYPKTLAECTAKHPVRAEPAKATSEKRVFRQRSGWRTRSQPRTTPILTSNICRKMTMTMRSNGYVIVTERLF